RKQGKKLGRREVIVSKERIAAYREEGKSIRWIANTLGVRVGKVLDGKCQLVSRRRHEYKSFHELQTSIADSLKVSDAIIDGEIVCLDPGGRSQFCELMFRRGDPFFYAFDLLWLN